MKDCTEPIAVWEWRGPPVTVITAAAVPISADQIGSVNADDDP